MLNSESIKVEWIHSAPENDIVNIGGDAVTDLTYIQLTDKVTGANVTFSIQRSQLSNRSVTGAFEIEKCKVVCIVASGVAFVVETGVRFGKVHELDIEPVLGYLQEHISGHILLWSHSDLMIITCETHLSIETAVDDELEVNQFEQGLVRISGFVGGEQGNIHRLIKYNPAEGTFAIFND